MRFLYIQYISHGIACSDEKVSRLTVIKKPTRVVRLSFCPSYPSFRPVCSLPAAEWPYRERGASEQRSGDTPKLYKMYSVRPARRTARERRAARNGARRGWQFFYRPRLLRDPLARAPCCQALENGEGREQRPTDKQARRGPDRRPEQPRRPPPGRPPAGADLEDGRGREAHGRGRAFPSGPSPSAHNRTGASPEGLGAVCLRGLSFCLVALVDQGGGSGPAHRSIPGRGPLYALHAAGR